MELIKSKWVRSQFHEKELSIWEQTVPFRLMYSVDLVKYMHLMILMIMSVML